MSGPIDYKQLSVALVDALKNKPVPSLAWLGPIPAAERDDIYLAMLSAAIKEDASALVGILADLVDKLRKRAETAEQKLLNAETRATAAEQRLEDELLPAQLYSDIYRNQLRESQEELAALRVHASSENDQAAKEIFELRAELEQLGKDHTAETAALLDDITTYRDETHRAHTSLKCVREQLREADEKLAQLRLELANCRTLLKEKMEEFTTATAAVLSTGTLLSAMERQRAQDAIAVTSATAEVGQLKAELDELKAELDELKAELAYYRGDAYAEDDDEEDTEPIGSEECGYLSDHGYGGADV